MNSVKTQSKASGQVSRRGIFQIGETISGEMTVSELMPRVKPGMPSPFVESNQPIAFKAIIHSVTDDGEITDISVIAELSAPSDTPTAGCSPILITLSNVDSYTVSTHPKTQYRVEAHWDQEAEVWFAVSDEVPGLATEAETLEALKQKLRVMVPELLQLNYALPDHLLHTLVIDLVSRRQELVEVA